MGLDIETGAVSATPYPVHPVDASATPGVQQPGLIQPGQLSGPTIPGRDVHGEWAAQMAIPLAECTAAMGAGMGAREAMLGHYEGQTHAIGSTMGELMNFPPSPLDPGAGVGNTAPTAAFYDPPREYGGAAGPPGYGGEQGAPGFQGEAQ